jgi:hypothetical protein
VNGGVSHYRLIVAATWGLRFAESGREEDFACDSRSRPKAGSSSGAEQAGGVEIFRDFDEDQVKVRSSQAELTTEDTEKKLKQAERLILCKD